MEKELQGLTVTKLREEAKKYPELTGVHAMKKDELIEAIMKASGQPMEKKVKTPAGSGHQKEDLKRQLKALKVERDSALENRDKRALKSVRTRMKKIKRRARRMETMGGGSS